MLEYSEILQRRIDQFAFYLKKMYNRSHMEACGPCFIKFKDRDPNIESDNPQLSEAVNPVLELVVHEAEVTGMDSITMDNDFSAIEFPEVGWREDNSQSRFIQFSIEEKWFCMDMPLQTLFRAEAEII